MAAIGTSEMSLVVVAGSSSQIPLGSIVVLGRR